MFKNKGMKFLLIQVKNLITLLAQPDTGNQHNCNKMCAMLSSLFTEFITRIESNWSERLYLNNYLPRGKGRSMNNSLRLRQISVNFYSLLCHYHIRAMEHKTYASVIQCRTGQEYGQK